MLSVYHIEKLFRQQQFETLLRGVCPIGMELSLPLRVRISQHPAAVTALALRRVLELTYGQTDLSRELIDGLLAMQETDGSFEGDPLSTAAAAETLQRVIDELFGGTLQRKPGARGVSGITAFTTPPVSENDAALATRIADAMDRAWQAVATMQEPDGLFRFADDRNDHDRAQTAAFIAMLVNQSEACRNRIQLHAVADWFEEHDLQVNDAILDVWRLAMVEQIDKPKTSARKSNQLAAIAA